LFVNVETNDMQVLPGDVLLLCSDGLHGAVSATEMTHVAGRHGDLSVAAQDSSRWPMSAAAANNVSVQLIRVLRVERMGMYRGRPTSLGRTPRINPTFRRLLKSPIHAQPLTAKRPPTPDHRPIEGSFSAFKRVALDSSSGRAVSFLRGLK